MSYADALQLLKMFQERDYAQGRPHFYIRSWKTGTWIRPKGMQILGSSNEIAIQHWETEEWESIPFAEVDFGLW